MKMEAEMGVIHLQAGKYQGLLTARTEEGTRKDSSPETY